MPTKRSQGMLGLIRSHKQFASGISRDVLMRIDPPAATVARLRMHGTVGAYLPDGEIPLLQVTPRTLAAEEAAILHLHGGAYVSGGLMQCRAIISPICASSGIRAFTFTYRLAPRHPYPAQLEDAWKAYRAVRSLGYAADRIALVGESAGGNLALALAAKLKKTGEGLPAAMALLSPWVDLAQKGDSYRTLAALDATLNGEELYQAAIDFAGSEERLTDPEISPLYGDFTGFPPTLIHCGTHEILLSDAERLEQAMLHCGVDAHLIRWAGMCHVFQAFGFEESKAANRQIGQFLKRQLTGSL